MKIFKNYRARFLWILLFGMVSCSTQVSDNDKFLENVREKHRAITVEDDLGISQRTVEKLTRRMKELLPFWKPYQTLEAFTKPKTVKEKQQEKSF